MYERFTDQARRVVVLARHEAWLLNHSYIGSEHLLLGLIREGKGVAAKVLVGLDISLSDARSGVEQAIGRGDNPAKGYASLTIDARTVIEHAHREALKLDHSHLGTEHLLLGLVQDDKAAGVRVLRELGLVDHRLVRTRVMDALRSQFANAQCSDAHRCVLRMCSYCGRFRSSPLSSSPRPRIVFKWK